MKDRILGLGLALLGAAVGVTGCETLRHEVRSKSEDTLHEDDSDDSKVIGVKPTSTKGFFKSSRLSGAMSDEGREIERDLGIK
jgi:hypothetical protein